MIILDGKKLKAEKLSIFKEEIEALQLKNAIKPRLAIIQVGDNKISNIYIKQKISFAEQIGVLAELVKLDENISEKEILEKINSLNDDKNIHGIILQLPIPSNINQNLLLNNINYQKDVDGLSSTNLSKLIRNEEDGVIPATARGIITLLKEYDIEITGKNIVIVGKSVLVGKSLALALTNLGATITLCHSKTKNLPIITKTADIIVSAVGKPGIINDACVSSEQIIVDVGISRDVENNIVGDVFLEKESVSAISPVPGGVGQMTVVSLFENLIDAYKKQNNLL